MKKNTLTANASLNKKKQLFATYLAKSMFKEALSQAMQILKQYPKIPGLLSDIAFCHLRLNEYDKAIKFALRSSAIDSTQFRAYDILSEVYGLKKDPEQVRHYGLKALENRDQKFSKPASLETGSQMTKPTKKIISFSLFGDSPRYLEIGFHNIELQKQLYPDWICRFYIDDSVPNYIEQRYLNAGAEVVRVSGTLKNWPGTMWRFSACDDATISHVIFRDADSLLSAREQKMVTEWLNSGQQFHIMRDYHSHTELMLAGMWGVKTSGLPNMETMVNQFLSNNTNINRQTDQEFLREYIWSYAKQSVYTHDRCFGFLTNNTEKMTISDLQPQLFHIGKNEASTKLSFNVGTCKRVKWSILENNNLICCYISTPSSESVEEYIPSIYAEHLNSGKYKVSYSIEI